MVGVSAAAAADVSALSAFYEWRGREEAIARLCNHVLVGCTRYQARAGVILAARRPYPELAIVGFRWMKEGPYWLAFARLADEVVLARVFHESADIPRRVREG